MKELKFRIWDDNQKLFTYFDLTFVPQMYRKGQNVMQYTGLKDKNGKEIYEGDICRREMMNVRDYEYNTVTWQQFLDGFPIVGEQWEIIGNIYENPELL